MTRSLLAPIRKTVRQVWRDILSVYYANTPTWRWLKSGALVFLGFFAWTGGAVLLSVEPAWGGLSYLMAYGFLLVVWGPLTHLVVVPLTIRLRRTATHPAARWLSRNSGTINLTIFFSLVILFGTMTPAIMMLEFSPSFSSDGDNSYSGELVCTTAEELLTCEVENASGIHSVEIVTGGETIKTVDGPPFEWEIPVGEIAETRRGHEYSVIYYNAEGSILHRQVNTV